MKRMGIDMDEVIADTLGELLVRYNRQFDAALTKDDLAGRRFYQMIPESHRPAIHEMFRDGEIFAELPVIEGSQEVIRRLQERYEVFITTAAMDVPSSFAAKFRWLAEHFPNIPPSHIVFCGDKSVLGVDYLIDDNSRHFERLTGEGILYTAPHNVHETAYRRVNDWAELERMFL
jgi:5'(3')-deoxyribonucleotidase